MLTRWFCVLFLVIAVVLTAGAAIADPPSGDVVISANTSWPEGTYQLESLTVNSGVTLTIAGGSTVNVSGTVLVTGASTILLQGKNTTAQVAGQWQGTGVTINAGSITVDAGSKISADGQGYAAGAGPGAGNIDPYMNIGSGGGYGGQGGASPPGAAIGGAVYGSSLTPVDLGSGGGGVGGKGGGGIRLNITGTFTLNGVITANGAAGTNTGCGLGGGGGGAGGSILVTTGELAGSGLFSANAGASGRGGCSGTGDDGGGGGGGRLAIYYAAGQSFTGIGTSTVNGGAAVNSGKIGTAAFINTTTNHLLVSGQTVTFGEDSVVNFAAITAENGAVITFGGGSTVNVTGDLVVTGSSTILLQAKNRTAQVDGQWQGTGVTITAGNITVEAGSKIMADGQGYVGGAGPGVGNIDPYMNIGSGGGYGGQGGASPPGGASGGAVYGTSLNPIEPGSGGGGVGGSGGGSIKVTVSGTLTLDGVISANGAAGVNTSCGLGGGGGGAGGSILVTTGVLAGSGTFTANGGAGGIGGCTSTGDDGGGGGGGRLAIYYGSGQSFTGISTSTANGGAGVNSGKPGTAAFINTTENHLRVSGQNVTFGEDSVVTFTAITAENGAVITFGGGSKVNVSGDLTVTGTSTILLQGKNRAAQVAGQWQGTGVTINAGNVTVEAGSKISADGQGYVGAAGPGAGTPDTYMGAGSGGGYGGQGASSGGGALGGVVYGSSDMPLDLGSGGGAAGGSGGGAIRLNVPGTLTLNGLISANGAAGTNTGCGAGAGGGGAAGSIYVTTGILTGTGAMTAQGGAGGIGGCFGTSDDGGAGGGGRIAVSYVTNNGFNLSLVTANGGGSGAATGTSQSSVLRGGDCNGDGKVSIAEVQAAINMYLGIMAVQACVDTDASGAVSIVEVQKVINGYLGL